MDKGTTSSNYFITEREIYIMATYGYVSQSVRLNNENYLTSLVTVTGDVGQMATDITIPASTTNQFIDLGDKDGNAIKLFFINTAGVEVTGKVAGSSADVSLGTIPVNGGYTYVTGVGANPFASAGSVSGVYVTNQSLTTAATVNVRMI